MTWDKGELVNISWAYYSTISITTAQGKGAVV
jgi:hypothetical protein